MNKILFYLIVFIFNFNNFLYAAEFKGTFFQGNLIVGKAEPKTRIYIDNKEIKVSNQGFFAFGLNKDRNKTLISLRFAITAKKIYL